MKNKDVIKKLQELDPEADIALYCMGDYNLLQEIKIEEESASGRGDSISFMYGIPDDTKMIVLSDGY
jgi:hypothetical protein